MQVNDTILRNAFICILSLMLIIGPLSPHSFSFIDTALADDDDGGDSDGGDDDDDDDDGFGSNRTGGRESSPNSFRLYRGETRKPRRRSTAPRRVIRGEILGADLSDADIQRLRSRGFAVLGDAPQSILNQRITRLAVPTGRSTVSGLNLARRLIGSRQFARNSRYRHVPHGRFKPAGEPCADSCEAFQITRWSKAVGRCSSGITIGMIDTGVDFSHPSLKEAEIETVSVLRTDRRPSSTAHGTAIASLLVGSRNSDVVGAAPDAKLIAIDAFYKSFTEDRADTFDLIAALKLLVDRSVAVINMSLTGPDNVFLERAVAETQKQGVIIVAAVGEPGARMGYPGKYGGVIAVSSIDGRLRPSRLAARGKHVSFVAPGVGLTVAAPDAEIRRVDGSSFATPFVSAAYALGVKNKIENGAITELLANSARDLGATGRDPIYGWGLLQYSAFEHCQQR